MGKSLAEASGAAANIHVDFDAAVAALRALVEAILAKAGLGDSRSRVDQSASGSPGSRTASDAARVAAAFPGFRAGARGE